MDDTQQNMLIQILALVFKAQQTYAFVYIHNKRKERESTLVGPASLARVQSRATVLPVLTTFQLAKLADNICHN